MDVNWNGSCISFVLTNRSSVILGDRLLPHLRSLVNSSPLFRWSIYLLRNKLILKYQMMKSSFTRFYCDISNHFIICELLGTCNTDRIPVELGGQEHNIVARRETVPRTLTWDFSRLRTRIYTQTRRPSLGQNWNSGLGKPPVILRTRLSRND